MGSNKPEADCYIVTLLVTIVMTDKTTTCLLNKPLRFLGLLLAILCLSSCAKEQAVQHLEPAETNESVILIHGLGRSNTAMWLLASRLEDAGFHIQRVGYDSFNTSIAEIVKNVADQIDTYQKTNPGTIHFVGHSFGGLLIRAYLAEHMIPSLGRTVLIGTPNQGTPLADRVKDNWLLEAFNTPAQELGTRRDSFPLSLEDPYYQVGVIAGKVDSCIADSLMRGDNDGLVPVASTIVNNMTDFIIVDTGHSLLRYDKDVANQTVHFLRNGFFYR